MVRQAHHERLLAISAIAYDCPGGKPMVEATKKVDFWRWPESTWVNPEIDWKKGKFITAGVDIGSVSSQTVVVIDNQLYAYSSTRTGSDSPERGRKGMDPAPEKTGVTVDSLDYCIGTGYGRV